MKQVLGTYLAACLLLFFGATATATATGVGCPHVDWLPVLAMSVGAAPVMLALMWHLPTLSVTVVLAAYVTATFTGFGSGMLPSHWTGEAPEGLGPTSVDRLNGLPW